MCLRQIASRRADALGSKLSPREEIWCDVGMLALPGSGSGSGGNGFRSDPGGHSSPSECTIESDESQPKMGDPNFSSDVRYCFKCRQKAYLRKNLCINKACATGLVVRTYD